MQKGFASALALLAIMLMLNALQSQTENRKTFEEGLQSMVEAEQNNYLRNNLEQNTDQIIQKTLQTELQNGELDPERVNETIAQNLYSFIAETENQNPSIRFYWVETTPESYDRILLLETHPVSAGTLDEIMKTSIVKIGEITIGKTVFTGGINQNQALVAFIESQNHRDFFLVPHQYAVQAEVLQ